MKPTRDRRIQTLSQMEHVPGSSGTPVQKGSHPAAYTEQQKKEFVEEITSKRRRQILPFIAWAAFVIGLAATSGFRDHPPAWPLLVAWLFVIGNALFSLINWRCPACNKYLGKNLGWKHCPRCGIPFSNGNREP